MKAQCRCPVLGYSGVPSVDGLSQVLLRFNTFFTVAARPQAEADKKRVLHELAAYARPHPPARLEGGGA